MAATVVEQHTWVGPAGGVVINQRAGQTAIELGFRLGDIQVGSDSAGLAVLGQLQVLLVGLQRPLEQIGLAVQSVQLEIVLGQFRLL